MLKQLGRRAGDRFLGELDLSTTDAARAAIAVHIAA